MEYAGKIVDQTQGNYASTNAPRFFHKNGFTKMLTQFRKYQLIQISLLGRLAYESFKGASSEEKAAARRAFTWMFMQHGLLTGVKGLPLPAVALMLAGALGGDDDKDWERNLRKWADDPNGGLLLSRGLPAYLGLDLSGRIGMGNAFSILPYSDADFSKKGYKEAVFGLSGAAIGGLGGSLFDGIDKMSQGKYYQGLEAMAPKGVKDFMAGSRVANEGVKDSRGGSVMSADEVDFFAGMMKAVGLPTTAITEFQNTRGDLIELAKHFDEREARIKSKYADKDMSLAEATKEWRELQDAKTRWGQELKDRGVVNLKVLKEFKPAPMANLFKYPMKRDDRELHRAM